MMQFRALRVPTLDEDVGAKLIALINDLPGIYQSTIVVETQQIDIIFDEQKLEFRDLAQAMSDAGCPLWNINAALLTEVQSE